MIFNVLLEVVRFFLLLFGPFIIGLWLINNRGEYKWGFITPPTIYILYAIVYAWLVEVLSPAYQPPVGGYFMVDRFQFNLLVGIIVALFGGILTDVALIPIYLRAKKEKMFKDMKSS